jgi:hypothetical protein
MVEWLNSKQLHNNHYLLMDLKQRFLFNFSMNLRKVRDLSLTQKRKLVPLWVAQVSTLKV